MKEARLKKTTYCMIPTVRHSEKGKNYRIIKKINGCQEFRERKGGMYS